MANEWNPTSAAKVHDLKTAAYLDALDLPRGHEYVKRVKSYLQRMADRSRVTQGVGLVKQSSKNGRDMQIDAGPSIYKENEPCIQFRSGPRLSFGITLRDAGTKSRLISYRFDLRLPSGGGLEFFRIDLNPPEDKYDALHQPRSHFHPGFPQLHVPFPIMTPLEVLDRIFYVIEPGLSA